MKNNRFFDNLINLNLLIGQYSAWLFLFIAICMLLIVSLRYMLGIGAINLQEACLYAFAASWWFGAARTLHYDGHVRVDIFYRTFSLKRKHAINLFGHLFLLIPSGFAIAWMSFGYVERSWIVKEISIEPGGLPWVYVLKSLLLLCPTLLSLHALLLCITILANPRTQ